MNLGKSNTYRDDRNGLCRPNRRCKGGQFVLHAKAFHGNPYDGHTLKQVIEETQALTGREVERIYVDKGYRGHKASKPLRVFHSGQRRGVTAAIKRELQRRAAVEPVIGHMKSDGHLGRNFLKGILGGKVTPSSPLSATTSASSSGG